MTHVQTIHYFDAYPGVGKTGIAIDFMIRKGGNKVCLYVAPRIALLHEVAARIRSRVEQLYDRKEISDEDYYWFTQEGSEARAIHVVESESGSQISVGQFLQEEVDNARKGDIVLCSHENFVRNGKFSRGHDDIVVIFDEARKMILERKDQRIAVTPKLKIDLFRFLEPYRHPIYRSLPDGTKKYSGFSRFAVPQGEERTVLRGARSLLHERGKDSGVDTSPGSAFRNLINDLCNDRLDVYLKMPLNVEDLVHDGPSFAEKQKGVKENQSVFQVLSPARMFDGFGHVLVLSAYFRQSQIFHLLSNYHNIHPESGKRFKVEPIQLSKGQAEKVESRRRSIESRFREVRIYPLLSREQKVSTTNLDLSCLVPREKVEEFFQQAQEKLKLNREDVGSVLRGRRNTSGTKSVQLATRVRKLAESMDGGPMATNPRFRRVGFSELMVGYFHMAQHCVYVISSGSELKKRNCILGKPLISFNKKYATIFSSTPPDRSAVNVMRKKKMTKVISDLIDHPTQEELGVAVELALAGSLENRVVRVDDGHWGRVAFDYVIADPMGLNTYRDRNFIAYLSARNPTPEVASLFKAIVPEYSADDDYAGDSAVQAVTRLSVRDAQTGEKVYIVVPDLGLARILQRKLSTHLSNGEQMGPDEQEGAKINLFFAKQLDYVDVLSVVPKGTEDSRRSQAITQKKGFELEMEHWPDLLVRMHNELNNEEMKGVWSNASKRGVKNKQTARCLMRRAKLIEEFISFADDTLRTSSKRLPGLSKIRKSRGNATALDTCKKIRGLCEGFLAEGASSQGERGR